MYLGGFRGLGVALGTQVFVVAGRPRNVPGRLPTQVFLFVETPRNAPGRLPRCRGGMFSRGVPAMYLRSFLPKSLFSRGLPAMCLGGARADGGMTAIFEWMDGGIVCLTESGLAVRTSIGGRDWLGKQGSPVPGLRVTICTPLVTFL